MSPVCQGSGAYIICSNIRKSREWLKQSHFRCIAQPAFRDVRLWGERGSLRRRSVHCGLFSDIRPSQRWANEPTFQCPSGVRRPARFGYAHVQYISRQALRAYGEALIEYPQSEREGEHQETANKDRHRLQSEPLEPLRVEMDGPEHRGDKADLCKQAPLLFAPERECKWPGPRRSRVNDRKAAQTPKKRA